MCTQLKAQEDSLMNALEETSFPKTEYAYAIFKGTRVVNGQSVESPGMGVLQFHIAHRFGRLNSGAYNFFGLDEATIRMGFDYGITHSFAIGIGRSKTQKAYDGYLKIKLLQQCKGEKNIPFTLVLYSNTVINTERPILQNFEMEFKHKLVYTTQVLIARKFSNAFSFQLTPSYTHKNLVATAEYENDILALGSATRLKITKRFALTAEYFAVIPGTITANNTNNSLSVGFEIETGGHVFQIHLTNSYGMIESQFIPATIGQWSKGDILLGFNISRVFTIVRKKK
jgi:hypothetical protein